MPAPNAANRPRVVKVILVLRLSSTYQTYSWGVAQAISQQASRMILPASLQARRQSTHIRRGHVEYETRGRAGHGNVRGRGSHIPHPSLQSVASCADTPVLFADRPGGWSGSPDAPLSLGSRKRTRG